MSTGPSEHIWHFANRYGEAWKFTYDPGSGEGILSGADVNGTLTE
jgi:hypothetical protein